MRPAFVLAGLAACGPVHAPTDATTGTSTGDGSTSTGAPPTTGAIEDPDPGTSTSTGLTTEDDTCGFFCHDQGIPSCNPYAQDCPAGQKCVPYAKYGDAGWDANKCVDITGNQQPGEPCTAVGGPFTGIDDCAEGAICWDVDAGGHGSCVAHCSGDGFTPICPADHLCVAASEAVIPLCLAACDPLLQDCADDDLCLPLEGNGEFVCGFRPDEDAGPANAPCETLSACQPGLYCVFDGWPSACDPRATGCCQPFCQHPDGPCPDPEQSCLQWFDPMELPPGDPRLDIGLCLVTR